MINKSVVRGSGIPNYSNALGSISMTIYSPHRIPAGYYVYAYLRPDGTPYYIGKGKNKRAWQLHENIKRPSYNNITILEQELTEIGAVALERRMIQWYGRKDLGTGILRNRTDGDIIPAGFNAGRLITNQSKKGLRWFNNGKENRQFREGMQHEGFVNGRVTKK
jgi:hypothetical protein